MTWYADLHSHTLASDGALAPAALVALAASHGVRALAVTDHDTTAGLDEAAAAAAELGLELISGIEISAWHVKELHILGHFFDPSHEGLRVAMQTRAQQRRERVHEIAARLAVLGAPVDPEAILQARTHGNVGRPHIARALLAAGHVATMDEAFQRYLGRDGAAYVPAGRISAEEAVGLIHDAGGVASLAHPGVEDIDAHIPALAAVGLDALEIRHPAHEAERVSRYAALAAHLHLDATGGADYHEKPPLPGDHGISRGGLERLRARASKPFGFARIPDRN